MRGVLLCIVLLTAIGCGNKANVTVIINPPVDDKRETTTSQEEKPVYVADDRFHGSLDTSKLTVTEIKEIMKNKTMEEVEALLGDPVLRDARDERNGIQNLLFTRPTKDDPTKDLMTHITLCFQDGKCTGK